jgi:uncharacterized protein YjbJ (UPF0337 family)
MEKKMNKLIQTLPVLNTQLMPALFPLMGIVLLLCFSNAMGQAGSKDSQKFLEYSDAAKKSFAVLKKELDSTVALYNTLLAGEAKKPESTYKKLTQAIGSSEKAAAKSNSSVEKMQKQAEKVFSEWEKELASYQSEQLKELSVQQLDASKQRHEAMTEKMKLAIEACNPLMTSLNEQATFMARDLGPEAMTALQGPAEELNGMAQEVIAQIDAVMAAEGQDEAVLDDQAG